MCVLGGGRRWWGDQQQPEGQGEARRCVWSVCVGGGGGGGQVISG